ncbi:hypothetical protein, partial [Ktedonobacter robiniae]|uniref:hypothetical protein n=1 Tax=Ktedonobacter robiniae TaxID=2778365 RepID=UPI001F1A3B32
GVPQAERIASRIRQSGIHISEILRNIIVFPHFPRKRFLRALASSIRTHQFFVSHYIYRRLSPFCSIETEICEQVHKTSQYEQEMCALTWILTSPLTQKLTSTWLLSSLQRFAESFYGSVFETYHSQ